MTDREKVVKGLKCRLECGCMQEDHCNSDCPYLGDPRACSGLDEDVLALLKAQEPRVMTLDLPPEEWQDKVIWLEIKGKKPIPCLFRKCCDRMMFGRYERIMSFDAIGSSKEGGYFLRNYGVNWRCWTSRPTDEQMEAMAWDG